MTNKKKIKGVVQTFKHHQRTAPKDDYLKYLRPIMYWAKRKYGLSNAELHMMFFLYSEGLFTRSDFNEFNQILSWNNERFGNMMRDGWINKWRTQRKNQPALYELSFKGKYAVKTIYNKLNGEKISENTNMFKGNNSFSDKVHRNYIKKINKDRPKHNCGRLKNH